MTYRLDFAKLTCLHAGADANIFTDDDTYLVVNGKEHEVQNIFGSSSGSAAVGNPMGTGDIGFDVGVFGLGLNTTFSKNLSMQLFDLDGFEFLDLFQTSDDFMGSTSFASKASDPVGGQFEIVNVVSGSGSTYLVDFGVTKLDNIGEISGPILKPRKPNGRLASKEGGVLNGNNQAGTLIGFGGKDTIYGNNGDDILSGGAKNDTLIGGKGNDLIIGGKGKDLLAGGAGGDTFVIAAKSGLDTITDFRNGQDLVGLGNGLKFEDLSIVKGAGGTLIKAGNEQLALLQGVKPGQLSAASFVQMDSPYLSSLMNSTMATLKAA